MLRTVTFNQNKINSFHPTSLYVRPTQTEIKNSPQIVNASLDDAIKYGGEITRQALAQMNLRHDRKNIIVDTKVHMLMPGMSPAIPGWHTDGVPRNYETFAPVGKEKPDIILQENLNPARYHLMETGTANSHTEFIVNPLHLEDEWNPDYSLYKNLNEVVNFYLENELADIETVDYDTIIEFDWWNIHRGVPAKSSGWRFLIRVTESDYVTPFTDLRDIMRTQQQVYVPESYGW